MITFSFKVEIRAMDALPNDFHTIICGTGLVESILAAALARVGKAVLHLDKETFYGTQEGSFILNDLLNHHPQVPSEPAETTQDDAGNSVVSIPSGSILMSNPCFSLEGPVPPATSRKFCIDLSPKLIWSVSPVTDLLVRAGVNRYLEFKAVNSCQMYLQKSLQPVPCSKGDIFKNKLISLMEKNKLMKFLTSIQAPTPADQEILDAHMTKPFVEFLRARGLSANLIQFILYSIAMVQSDEVANPTLSTADGLPLIIKFVRSAGKFGPTPYIIPMYGTSELPQAFCRLAAVYGATYMLGHCAKKLILKDEIISAIVDSAGQKINCQFMVSNADHLPHYFKEKKTTISRGMSPFLPFVLISL